MTRKVSVTLTTMAAVLVGTAWIATAQENGPTHSGSKKSESLLVTVQKICPVMGKSLCSMGEPVKAKVGDQTVFLCCKGCLKGQVQKKHWDQIQANLIAAQGNCPVMGKPQPKDPASIVVKGRTVFVCCSPCAKKIQAEPMKYLTVVDKLLAQNSAKNG